MITVERTGPQALVQDLGRPGHAALGVSPSGAADRAALRLANRMVGNPESAAAVECVGGGLAVRAEDLHWLVVTGAPTQLRVNGSPTGSHVTLALRRGDRIEIDPPERGLRSYLAVRGGLLVPTTLGSAATDLLSGLGPAPLVAGQQLAVGRADQPLPDTGLAAARAPLSTLAALPGPRRDWFTDAAWHRLGTADWTVAVDSNRVAVRLDGPALARRRSGELASEGLLRGAVQVPPSGQPLIFGADHPVTGGYPVIAVLTDRAADDAAQLRPGQRVRFALDSHPPRPRRTA